MALGITNRLMLSFAAVAVLAAAANLIAENGVEVIRTHHLDSGLTSAPIAIEGNGAAPRGSAASAAGSDPRELNGPLLAAAIERHQRAVEVRAAVDSPAATAEERAAAQSLESTWESAQQAADAPEEENRPRRQALHNYEAAGRNCIRLADARRAALQEIAWHADALEGQLKTSLDGAWKIFGRVLARQSLMQLRSELDDISRGIARERSADGDRSAMIAVMAGEAAFEATFNGNAAALARAEGGRWVAELRENSRKLAELIESITKLDSEARVTAGKFGDAHGRLWSATPARTSLDAQPPAPSQAPPRPARSAAPARLPIASPVIDSIITTSTALEDRERRLMGWITAAVLAVILTISVWTVRSIVVPVRRMTRATKKIADGEVDVRVPGGGLKELDTLSRAFNGMAQELAEARSIDPRLSTTPGGKGRASDAPAAASRGT